MEENKKNPNIPPAKPFINPAEILNKLYANGFAVGYTSSDMYLIGQLNGTPSFVLNMSFTSAKSLSESLKKVVKDFESKAHVKVHTMNEITENITKETIGKQ